MRLHEDTTVAPHARAESSAPARSAGKVLFGYGVMLVTAALALSWVYAVGSRIHPASALTPAPAARALAAKETLPHVILALLVIMASSRAFGSLLHRFAQPRVLGEIVAGVALGPSLLGSIWPAGTAFLFPANVVPSLGVLAQLGVILFMFLIGLELDPGLLRRRSHAALAISHASMLTPMALGGLLALYLYPQLASGGTSFAVFGSFMSVAMSVTAFPVLARILKDRNMQGSEVGTVALCCAAVDDVSAWCLLAGVIAFAQAQPSALLPVLLLTLCYVALVLLVLRPVLQRWAHAQDVRGRLDSHAFAALFVLVLVSALATEWIGIHALFGAFLIGVVIPHDSLLARELTAKLESLVSILLLPIFFAFTGLRTEFALISGPDGWWMFAAIVAVACVGKFGGTFVAARFVGVSAADSARLGALMNTRGLMELIVLNIGLDLDIISPRLFAMAVLMAVLTTFAAGPLLSLLDRYSHAAAQRARLA